MISAVMLTKNESNNIELRLKELNFCDEIIIIDDNSVDNTRSLAKSYGAKILERNLDGDFAGQRNFGLSKANGEWILFIDADEEITTQLREEIKLAISGKLGNFDGYYVKRQDKFLGRWLRHGETSKVKLLRLAKKNVGQWQGKVHEIWQINGDTTTLKNPLQHQRNLLIRDFLIKINFYSDLRSDELYKRGEKTNILLITLYPLAKFLHIYIWQLGVLDGMPGLIMAGLMSLHSFMTRAKLWVRINNRGKEEFIINDWKKYAQEKNKK